MAKPVEPGPEGQEEITAAIAVHEHHAAHRDKLDAEATEIIARLRQTLADNEDVMTLCNYIEWYIAGSPLEPDWGGRRSPLLAKNLSPASRKA
jgi:hypothetical protein